MDGVRAKNFLPIAVLCLASGAMAQNFPLSSEPESLPAKKMSTPPVIDGTINSAEWASAAGSSRSLIVIASSQPSGDKAQFWFGYDEKYVYVAVRTILENPSQINADEFRQNVSLRGNDAVSIYLDVFGNSTQFSVFSLNPIGATNMQIAGGRAAKQEWLGQFDAAGSITDTGWEGEARIAWDLMPMPESGVRDMKFLLDWYVSSKQQGISSHATQGNFTRMHVWKSVDTPEISQSRKINLLPYTYIGIDDNGNHVANAGLDVKTSLNDQLNFVTTVNPDFRNIENDILDISFSNFERLADETRPFFVEGSQFLSMGQVMNRKLFAPQRIGSFDTGINVYGTLSDTLQMGVLSTIDQGNQQTLASEFSYSPNSSTSFIGNFAALDKRGEENLSLNLEYFNFMGDYLMFAQTMQSDDEITGKGNTLAFGTQYRTSGMEVVYAYQQVSQDFNPRIGFAPETDFKGHLGLIRLNQSYSSGDIRESSINVTGIDNDRYDGGHYRELASVNGGVTLRSGLAFDASATADHFLDRHDEIYGFGITMPRNDPYRQWGVRHTTGYIANMRYNSTSVSARYRPIKRLQLAARYQKVDFVTKMDQTVFTFNWEMDKWQSIGGRVVGVDDQWNWFASYSMRGNLGAEYFLIVGDPNADSFQSSVILKVSMPLTIGG